MPEAYASQCSESLWPTLTGCLELSIKLPGGPGDRCIDKEKLLYIRGKEHENANSRSISHFLSNIISRQPTYINNGEVVGEEIHVDYANRKIKRKIRVGRSIANFLCNVMPPFRGPFTSKPQPEGDNPDLRCGLSLIACRYRGKSYQRYARVPGALGLAGATAKLLLRSEGMGSSLGVISCGGAM